MCFPHVPQMAKVSHNPATCRDHRAIPIPAVDRVDGRNRYDVWQRDVALGLGPCDLIQANCSELAIQALNAVDPLLPRYQLSHTLWHSP